MHVILRQTRAHLLQVNNTRGDTEPGLTILDCLTRNGLRIESVTLEVFYNRLNPQIIIALQTVITVPDRQ